jgi:WD40 repeat protein/serine/threonine protein kinase
MSSAPSKELSSQAIAAVRRIDAICDRLEEALQTGRPWRLEDFLATVEELEQPALLRQLLLLEWDYRQQRGDRVDVMDYLARFPAHSTLIRETSEEHTLELEAESKSPTAPEPPASLLSSRATQDWSERGYLIVSLLGRGGMSTVYLACQTAAERLVALKVLHDGADHGPSGLDRFRREAQTLARLQHPNIVSVFEVGEWHGEPFYSMEYCVGGTLADYLRSTRMTPIEAATLVETLARAAHAAHQAGVIHRDLKPSNVLLSGGAPPDHGADATGLAKNSERPDPGADATGLAKIKIHGANATGLAKIPKLADFGLAKRLDASAKTQTGAVLGTPQYMAPEQARGESQSVDVASDVYGLGAILYECLTGRPPFVGSSVVDIVLRVMSDEVALPTRLQPNVPRDLETICLKCLHKEPRQRYADAAAVAEDLRRFQAGEPILARPAGVWERTWQWAKRHPAVAALLGVLVMSSVFGLSLSIWALRQRDLAIVARKNAKNATREVELQRRSARRQTAVAMYEQALLIGQQQGAASAMLWLAESLPPSVEVEATELEQSIRRQLGAWSREVRHLKRVYAGHDAIVLAVAFSPDGRWIVSGSPDATAKLYDVATGRPVCPPLVHPDTVFAVAFSPDGRTVLTGCADGQARLWDAASGKPMGQTFPHTNRVLGVAFSPDGKLVATGSHDKTARLWETDTGRPLTEPLEHGDIVRGVAFRPDGKAIATASDDKTARLWEVPSGRLLGEPLVHEEIVRAVAFSPDGKRLATGCSDKCGHLWDVATGKRLGQPMQHEEKVMAVAFSPDGTSLVTSGDDNTVRFWQATTGLPLAPPLRHQAPVRAVACSPDGSQFATGSFDCIVRLWDVPRITFLNHPDVVHGIAFSPDSRILLTGNVDGKARIWDVATRKPLDPPLHHDRAIYLVAISPDGQTALTSGWDGSLRLWNLATRELRHQLPNPKRVFAAAFSHDSRRVLTGGEDHTARLWDVATGRSLIPPLEHQYFVASVAFSRDGKTLLTGSHDGTVRLWEAATGRALAPVFRHPSPAWRAEFSPDCKTVLTGSQDRTARLWDATTGNPIGTPLSHFHVVNAATFSPDGKWVVTGSVDKTARLWQASTQKTVGSAMNHADSVICAVFSPDGQFILTGSFDKTAQLWELPTCNRLGPPFLHNESLDAFDAAAFSPDGRQMVTYGAENVVRLWEVIPPVEGDPERIILWTQVITRLELDGNGGVRILDAATWRDRQEKLERLGGFPIQ